MSGEFAHIGSFAIYAHASIVGEVHLSQFSRRVLSRRLHACELLTEWRSAVFSYARADRLCVRRVARVWRSAVPPNRRPE